MEQRTAYLDWSLHIKCPGCEHRFDIVEQDRDDHIISRAVFNNDWDAAKGEEVECPKCEEAFEIKEIVY